MDRDLKIDETGMREFCQHNHIQRVNLNTRGFLSRHFRDRLEREAVVRYAASR